jgi:hypothetical protein
MRHLGVLGVMKLSVSGLHRRGSPCTDAKDSEKHTVSNFSYGLDPIRNNIRKRTWIILVLKICSVFVDHRQLQSVGLLACFALPVRRTVLSISAVVEFWLFFL